MTDLTKRRDFLKGAASAAAFMALPNVVRAQSTERGFYDGKSKRVIAQDLIEQGIDALVNDAERIDGLKALSEEDLQDVVEQIPDRINRQVKEALDQTRSIVRNINDGDIVSIDDNDAQNALNRIENPELRQVVRQGFEYFLETGDSTYIDNPQAELEAYVPGLIDTYKAIIPELVHGPALIEAKANVGQKLVHKAA